LNVTDAVGDWDIDTMTVSVNDTQVPVANAGPDQTVDMGNVVIFNGSVSADNIGIVKYAWSFNDGSLVTLFTAGPTHKFDTAGTFIVALNVTDAAGNWAVDSLTVTVNDILVPIANAGVDQTVDQGAVVFFNGSASTDNVGIVNFTWSFVFDGKNVKMYGSSPSFTLDIVGVYVVTLNVSDAVGNWNTDTITISVLAVGDDDITPDDDVTPPDDDTDDDLTPGNDTDSDGLPDSWEQLYFGNLDQGPNDDPDKDGLTNLQEYQQGKKPTIADNPVSDDDDTDDDDSGSNMGLVIGGIIAGIVLLLIVIGAIVFLFMRKKKQEPAEQIPPPEQKQNGPKPEGSQPHEPPKQDIPVGLESQPSQQPPAQQYPASEPPVQPQGQEQLPANPPVEQIPSPEQLAMQGGYQQPTQYPPQGMICPTCNQPGQFYQEQNLHWCANCQKQIG